MQGRRGESHVVGRWSAGEKVEIAGRSGCFQLFISAVGVDAVSAVLDHHLRPLVYLIDKLETSSMEAY